MSLMSRKCVVFGVSKIAEVLYQTIKSDTGSDIEISGFCVDAKYRSEDTKFDLPVVDFESVEKHFPPSEYSMLIAIGYHDMNRVRKEKFETALEKGYELPGYSHGGVTKTADVSIGRNVLIFDSVSIGAGTKIGDDTVIFSGATISHHATVGRHNWITSGTVIGGNTTVGDNCFLGIASSIGHNVRVGNMVFMGSKAVITKDAADNGVYIVPDTPRYRLESEQFVKLFKFD